MKKHRKLGLKKNFKKKIAIIGVGYVGLPLAKSLSKYYNVNAFDTNKFRIKELKKGIDRNLEFKKNIVLCYSHADYNDEMDANDQLNQSLMLDAKAAGQEYAGRMTARAQKFAAVGSLLSDANKMGYIG